VIHQLGLVEKLRIRLRTRRADDTTRIALGPALDGERNPDTKATSLPRAAAAFWRGLARFTQPPAFTVMNLPGTPESNGEAF
jgi:hypothetical protein